MYTVTLYKVSQNAIAVLNYQVYEAAYNLARQAIKRKKAKSAMISKDGKPELYLDEFSDREPWSQ